MLQLDAGLGRLAPERLGDALEMPAQIHRLGAQAELAGLDARQQHQVLDQAAEPSRLPVDHAGDAAGVLGGDPALVERLGVAADGRQRGPQIVGHAHQELPLPAPGLPRGPRPSR